MRLPEEPRPRLRRQKPGRKSKRRQKLGCCSRIVRNLVRRRVVRFARPQTLLQIRQHGGQFADRPFAQPCGGTRLFAQKLLEYVNLPYRFAFFQAFLPAFLPTFLPTFLPPVQSPLISRCAFKR